MDTSKDYRLIIAQDAVERLDNIIRYHKLNLPLNWNKLSEILKEIKKIVLKLRYSYLPINLLLQDDDLNKLKQLSVELSKSMLDKNLINKFKPDPRILAETRYCLRIFYGLKYRLSLGEENKPWYAIDVEGVEIVSVHKHPNADKLFVTKADGILPYTIVTNIQDIKKGEVRAAAILPPAVIRDILSEAMYCSNPIPREYKKRRPPENLYFKEEVGSKVIEIAKKYLH